MPDPEERVWYRSPEFKGQFLDSLNTVSEWLEMEQMDIVKTVVSLDVEALLDEGRSLYDHPFVQEFLSEQHVDIDRASLSTLFTLAFLAGRTYTLNEQAEEEQREQSKTSEKSEEEDDS